MDPKKANKLDEIDNLRLQYISLRIQLSAIEHNKLITERDELGKSLLAKYGAPREVNLKINTDGAIERGSKQD